MSNRWPQDITIPTPIYDAVRGAPGRVGTFLDFFSNEDIGHFTGTVSGTGATAPTVVDDGSGVGALSIDTGTADDSYVTLQSKRTFYFTPGDTISFGGKIQLNEVTQNDLFMGVIGTGDTAPIAGVSTAGLYFLKLDGAATVDFIKNISGTPTTLKDDIDTLVVDTYVTWHVHVYVTSEATADIVVFVDGSIAYAAENVTIFASTVACRFAVTHQLGDTGGVAYLGTADYFFWDAPRG